MSPSISSVPSPSTWTCPGSECDGTLARSPSRGLALTFYGYEPVSEERLVMNWSDQLILLQVFRYALGSQHLEGYRVLLLGKHPSHCAVLEEVSMTAVLIALVLAAIPSQLADVPDSDREAVRQTSLDYVAGFLSANPERIERGVHPSLQKVVVRSMQGGRETLAFMDRHTLSEFARMSEGQPEAERLVDVTVLEILRNTAVVRIDSPDFVDHAQIANINGAWRIVNVLWAPKDGQSLPEVGSEDRTAIEQAGFDYVDGYYAGSAERLGKALHPRLQKVTVRSLPNGREIFGYASADGLADYASTGQSRKAENERAVDVELLYAEGNIATIRIDSVDFVDFAHVARINGEWVIVNVLWFPRG